MLSKEQIDYLYDFCYSEGVIYYDVQVELVDHLANAIEKELANDPGWTFEKALIIAVNSFGDKKFKSLLENQRAAARQYCQRIFLSNILRQLAWPSTWLILAAFLSGFWLLDPHGKQIVLSFFSYIYFIGMTANITNFWTNGLTSVIDTKRIIEFTDCLLLVGAGDILSRLCRMYMGTTGVPMGLIYDLIILGVPVIAAFAVVLVNRKEVRRQVQTGMVFLRVDMNKPDRLLLASALPLLLLSNWSDDFAAGPAASILFLLATILCFVFCVVCMAYYRTLKQLKGRLKKDFPAAFEVAR
jgi:hypothetical protein